MDRCMDRWMCVYVSLYVLLSQVCAGVCAASCAQRPGYPYACLTGSMPGAPSALAGRPSSFALCVSLTAAVDQVIHPALAKAQHMCEFHEEDYVHFLEHPQKGEAEKVRATGTNGAAS
jgi:hypothetical protein